MNTLFWNLDKNPLNCQESKTQPKYFCPPGKESDHGYYNLDYTWEKKQIW